MSNNPLLSQIRQEYQEGYNYVRAKRIQYYNRIQKYDVQKKEKNKINIHMILNAIDTLTAVSFSDGLTQKFIPTDGRLGQDRADKLNYVAKFDANEDDYQQMKYQVEQDRYFFGVGIRVLQNFDEMAMKPSWLVINPLTWIPDPNPSQTGKRDGNNYRYTGFVLQTTFFDLRANPLIDRVGLYDLLALKYKYSQDTYLLKLAQANQGNYIMTSIQGVSENFACEIYYHYTIFEGKKIMAITNADQTIILGTREIPAVLKSEKEDPRKITRPFVLNYYSPIRNDPFGKSICDLLEDKQDAKSILYNLSIIKAKKEALGGDFLVNSRLVKNRQELTKPTTDSRYIVADIEQGENIGNAMMEVPRSQIKSDVFNMMNLLEKEVANDTGVDALQQGILPDKNVTATESQQVQANANLKNILKNSINSWGEKQFWKLWYKEYVYKFTSADEKFIILNNDFEFNSINLKRVDFLGNADPYIMIGTKADIEAMDKQMLNEMNLERPMFMQSTAPEISKVFFLRHLYRLKGFKENNINQYVPLTPSERKSKEFVDIINIGQIPKSIFEVPGLDLFTAYIYIQRCDDNEAKRKVLQVLQIALMDQGLGQYSLGGGEAAANQASGIQMAQSANQQGQPLSRGASLEPNMMQNA